MKIKPFYILSFLAVSLALTFQACEEEDKTFTGDPIFAFEQTQYNNVVINHLEPNYDLPVMLVGPHQPQAVASDFIILPFWVNESGDTLFTTMEEGVHFASISSKTVEVAANSSYGYIPLTVNFDNLEKGQEYQIIIELTGGDFGISPIGNNLVVFKFVPHLFFIPEDFTGTFPAREISNQPNFVREYNVTFELDSSLVDASNRLFYFSVSGLWSITAGDSTATAWDRKKISILVDDSSPVESIVTVDEGFEVQNFFKLTDGSQINWVKRDDSAGAFDTWTNTFSFPPFDLKRADETLFPPQPATPRGQNVRVELLLDVE